jgi:hypothetical protein
MPARTTPMTGFEANCLAAAVHFIACRGSKPATRVRARFDRIDQAEAFAATFGDSRTMIYAVKVSGGRRSRARGRGWLPGLAHP